MGASVSKSASSSDIVNKAATQVLLSSSQSCSQNNLSNQEINFNNIHAKDGCKLNFSGINQTSVMRPDFSCAQSSENAAKIASEMKNKMELEAKANTGQLIGIGGSFSDAHSKLINDVSNNVNISSLSKCVQDNISKQTMNYSDITLEGCNICSSSCNSDPVCIKECTTTDFKDINQNLISKSIGDCLSEQKTVAEAVTKYDNDVKAITSSLTEMSVMACIAFIVICCISVILSFVSAFMSGGEGE